MNWESQSIQVIGNQEVVVARENQQNIQVINNWLNRYLDNQNENLVNIFLWKIVEYLDYQTNRITISLENVLKEDEISKDDLAILISKLEEIKAIIPIKDQSGYFLNPWIANRFECDENKAFELASKFPSIDITNLN